MLKSPLVDLLVALGLTAGQAEPFAALLIEVVDATKLYASAEEYRHAIMYRAGQAQIEIDRDTAVALAMFAHALVVLGDVLDELEPKS